MALFVILGNANSKKEQAMMVGGKQLSQGADERKSANIVHGRTGW